VVVAESEPLRILVVDDEEIVLKRLSEALTRTGYEVEVCLGGREAIARLSERNFDIVVTDLRMGEVDGIDVLAHARETCPQTQVILITAYATIEIAREALTKGAFDFVAKPFKPNDLREVIARAVKKIGT
jgi:DNA-binding NtrC family response regulator